MGRVTRPSAPALRDMEPYDPKYLPAEIFMSANENPNSMPDAIHSAIIERLRSFDFNRYPDPLANTLRDRIAQAEGLQRENVLVGNGGDELIFDTFLAWGGPGRTVLNFPPTFSVYATDAVLTNTELVELPRDKDDFSIDFQAACELSKQEDVDIIVITSPNNPTGTVASEQGVLRILESTDALVLLDEAYCEFSGKSMVRFLDRYPNLLILRTFSKAFGLAGVRLGYLLGDTAVINEFKKVRQPYSVDSVSQIIGEEVIARRNLFEPIVGELVRNRCELIAELGALEGVEVFSSDSNYVLFRVPCASEVWRHLYEQHSVLVRDVSSDPLLADCLRVTVGTARENRIFLTALHEVLEKMR